MSALAYLTGLPLGFLSIFLAVFVRVGAVLALVPGLGEQSVPMRLRLAIAAVISLIAAPAVAGVYDLSVETPADLLRLLPAEAVTGLALGLSLRLLIVALQVAGSIAAQVTSLAQLLGGAAGEPLPTIGHILTMAGLALLMITGFPVKIVSLVILSYDVLPPGRYPLPGDTAVWGSSAVSSSFALGFSLAAPFVLISALYNLTLGVINRAMPQLMVALVGAPLITFGAIAMLMLSAPVLLAVWLKAADAILLNPFGAD